MKITGPGDNARNFVEKLYEKFNLESIQTRPGNLRIFNMNLVQSDDFTIEANEEEKMNAVSEYPISRPRRKEIEDKMYQIEQSTFSSVNSTLGWLGITACPFCVFFYSSYLQQKAPSLKMSNIVEQISIARNLKKIGRKIKHILPPDKNAHTLMYLYFWMHREPKIMVKLE